MKDKIEPESEEREPEGEKEKEEELKIGAKKEEKARLDEVKELKKRLKHKEAETKGLQKQNQELKEEYLRQLADKENLRKRLEREKSDFFQYALSEMLKDFLFVMDNFERALESADQTNGKSFKEGVEMIYRQFREVMMKNGVNPIEIKDKKFDPRFHQAFATEESEEVEEAIVDQELLKGYLLHDRLLRPSLVRVIVPKKGK